MDSSSWEKLAIEPTDDEIQQILDDIATYRVSHRIDTELNIGRLDEQTLRSCAVNLFPLYDRLYQKIEDLSVWDDYFEELVVLAVIDDVDFRMCLFERYEISTPAGKYLMGLLDSYDQKDERWTQKNAQRLMKSSVPRRNGKGSKLRLRDEVSAPTQKEKNRVLHWWCCAFVSMIGSFFLLVWGGIYSIDFWKLAIGMLVLDVSIYCWFEVGTFVIEVRVNEALEDYDNDNPIALMFYPLFLIWSEETYLNVNRSEVYLGEKWFYIRIIRNALMLVSLPIAQMVANKSCRRFMLKPSLPFVCAGVVVAVFVTVSLIVNIRKRRQNR